MTGVDVATGTDIVSVARMAKLARSGGTAFLGRWFTSVELDYCLSKAFPARHLAARFAAKEAVLKALRTPWRGPLPWRCIEIAGDPGGVPSVRLAGPVQQLAADADVDDIAVSLSHTDEYATATVIAIRRCKATRDGGDPPPGPWAAVRHGEVPS
jgi:holo-[acyl-carrier protein] synthase